MTLRNNTEARDYCPPCSQKGKLNIREVRNRQKPSSHPPHLLSGRLPSLSATRMQTSRADSPVPPGIKWAYFISKIGKDHCRKRGMGAPQHDIPVSLGG